MLSLAVMIAAALASPATAAGCTLTGPRWDLYGIHDGTHVSGKRSVVTREQLSCRKAKRHIRWIFKHIDPRPTGIITGPSGFLCHGSGSGDKRNRMFSGSCIGTGTDPLRPWVDLKRFTWDPLMKSG